jgi:hypothetical protein
MVDGAELQHESNRSPWHATRNLSDKVYVVLQFHHTRSQQMKGETAFWFNNLSVFGKEECLCECPSVW